MKIQNTKFKISERRCDYKDARYQMPDARASRKIENSKYKISEMRCNYKDASYQMPDARASQEIKNSKCKIQNFGTLRVDYKKVVVMR